VNYSALTGRRDSAVVDEKYDVIAVGAWLRHHDFTVSTKFDEVFEMSLEGDRKMISRTAACVCGSLAVRLRGAAVNVHACSCSACQRDSGSAFSYTAFFPESAVVAIEGEYRNWRRITSSGRWTDSSFCPTCGATVFRRWEALPGIFGVRVGCFADPAFEPPAKMYFSSQRYHWLSLPKDVELIETQ